MAVSPVDRRSDLTGYGCIPLECQPLVHYRQAVRCRMADQSRHHMAVRDDGSVVAVHALFGKQRRIFLAGWRTPARLHFCNGSGGGHCAQHFDIRCRPDFANSQHRPDIPSPCASIDPTRRVRRFSRTLRANSNAAARGWLFLDLDFSFTHIALAASITMVNASQRSHCPALSSLSATPGVQRHIVRACLRSDRLRLGLAFLALVKPPKSSRYQMTRPEWPKAATILGQQITRLPLPACA